MVSFPRARVRADGFDVSEPDSGTAEMLCEPEQRVCTREVMAAVRTLLQFRVQTQPRKKSRQSGQLLGFRSDGLGWVAR